MQCCIIADLLGFAYIVTVAWCIINWCHTHTANLSCIFTETAWMCAWFCDGASIWLDVKMIDEKRMWNALWNCVFSILLNNFEILRTIISFPMMLRCSTTKLKSVISCHCNASNTFLNVAGSLKSLLQNYSTALTLSCLRLLSNFWRIQEIL